MFADLEHNPRTLLVWDRSSLREEKNRLHEQVQQLHFNYKVSVLLPECDSAPSHLDTALNSFSSFCLIRQLPLYELLDKDFLETLVYQGGVCGLSHRTRIDEENCAALMSNGRLCLSVDKDTFEMLGVEGKPSRFNHRTTSRYVISVDLTDRNMAAGGRGHQRLLTGLTSRVQLRTDFLLSYRPEVRAALQPLLSRYDWSEHTPEVSSRVLTDLSSPDLLTSDLQSCDPHSFLEWLGAVEADISCENQSSSFLSTFICPEPKVHVSQTLNVSVCGLLLPTDICRLIQELRHYLEQRRPLSWVALTAHGFADSPVSWGVSEHGALRGGEHFYTLLLFQDLTYHLLQSAGAHDTCPP